MSAEARLPPIGRIRGPAAPVRWGLLPGARVLWDRGSVPSPQLIAQRCRAQLLSGPPAPQPAAVAERLLAIQAQDPRSFRLAIRARTTGLTAADVEVALNDRSLLVTWLNRGTLHLVRRRTTGGCML